MRSLTLATDRAHAEHFQPVLLYAEAGLSFHRRNHGVEVAAVELHRLIAPLADNVMAVAVRLIAACLVLSARKAQRIGVTTFGQVQLAHQPQRKQEIQRTIDGDQSQRRMVRGPSANSSAPLACPPASQIAISTARRERVLE